MSTLLDPHAAAARLGFRVKTLAVWRGNGNGPPYAKLNGRIRYRIADLDEWVANRIEEGCQTDQDGVDDVEDGTNE